MREVRQKDVIVDLKAEIEKLSIPDELKQTLVQKLSSLEEIGKFTGSPNKSGGARAWGVQEGKYATIFWTVPDLSDFDSFLDTPPDPP